MPNSQAATIDAIAECCGRIEAMCAGLDEDGWHRATALPGWDIQDVVAHLGSLEAMFMGRHEPPHDATVTDHVRNPLGELNERLVDRRRAWTGAEVLAEFREVTAQRLHELASLDEAGLATEVLSPRGTLVPLASFLGTRLWDYAVHELDIAEALGGDLDTVLDTTSGRRMLDEMLLLLPRGVAKGGAPEGVTVVLDISPPLPRTAAARVEGGRGVAANPGAEEAALHLRASPAVFVRVATGRRDPGRAIARGDVTVDGDPTLGEGILAALNVIP